MAKVDNAAKCEEHEGFGMGHEVGDWVIGRTEFRFKFVRRTGYTGTSISYDPDTRKGVDLADESGLPDQQKLQYPSVSAEILRNLLIVFCQALGSNRDFVNFLSKNVGTLGRNVVIITPTFFRSLTNGRLFQCEIVHLLLLSCSL